MKARQPCRGAVEFDEVDAGSYTVKVWASKGGEICGVGSAEVAVSEGETASCSVLMSRVYTAAQAAERISDNNGENWNIIVAGPIDYYTLLEISENLNSISGRISLDLSRTTGLTEIGTSKFMDCTSLSGIVLPEGIGSIEENAFTGCSALESIELPGNLPEISCNTFNICKKLKSIYIPVSVKEIGTYAFDECDALTTVNYGGTEAEWENITIKSNNPPFESGSGTKIIFSNDATKTL